MIDNQRLQRLTTWIGHKPKDIQRVADETTGHLDSWVMILINNAGFTLQIDPPNDSMRPHPFQSKGALDSRLKDLKRGLHAAKVTGVYDTAWRR